MKKNRLLRLTRKALSSFTDEETLSSIMDDLSYRYDSLKTEKGKPTAVIRHGALCLLLFISFLSQSVYGGFIMFTNYLKMAFRSLHRHKGFFFINIFGLAIGLSCCFLVSIYVFDELNYDRFHKDADRIYRIQHVVKSKDFEHKGLETSYILAKTLREDYTDKFLVAQIRPWGSIVSADSRNFGNERIIGADSHFFEMFTYQLVAGNPKTVLHSPNEAIITDKASLRYFGNARAYGQTIRINGNPFRISGILKQNQQNSHFNFDVLFSLSSLRNYGDTRYLHGYYSTYVKLPLSAPVSRLKNILDDYEETHLAPLLANTDENISFSLEPMLDIHLKSDLNGPYGANSKIEYVYIFSVISFLILIIACINYVNLTNAKNLSRAREVGIRKVVGSLRRQITTQFLLESVVFCWIAMGIALILLLIYLPFFNNLTGKSLRLDAFNNPLTIIGFILFAAAIGVMAGVFPALYISSFRPVRVLKASFRSREKKLGLQSTLVVFQCTVSVLFMISTLVIHKQLILVQKKDLGFDKEQIIVLQRGGELGRHKEAFKSNLLKHPEIINVTGTSSLPGTDLHEWKMTPEDLDSHSLSLYFCDHNFAETMGIDILKGRFFSKNNPSDERAIVINEKAVEEFGWTDDPIGRKIRLNVHGDYTVIGVIKNFHYQTLHTKLGKMGMLLTQGRYYGSEMYLAVKFSSQNIAEVISTIKQVWNSIIPNIPFEYSFLDEDYYRLYQSEQQMQKIVLLFSFLAIFISALGMLGLVSFSVEKRRKEIGVRKILGASAIRVELLLCKELLKWILLANIIACPLAYYVMNKWLSRFAYRALLSAELFVLPGILAFGIALMAVSVKVFRAAVANPVEALRYE